MWSEHVYRTLYILIHSLYTIFECVQRTLNFIKSTIVTIFCHEVLFKSKQIYTKIEKINKKPAHLTVLLGHEEPSLKDLANLIIWCLATQISFISFYDYKGSLKKNEEELQYEVNQRKCREDHVIWHRGLQFSYKNGFIGRKVHVKIITQEDGKSTVVNVTREISLSKDREFDLETISNMLHKKFEFPDPDLGLVCGKTLSLYNYPPWQIRVTEFFTIESLHNITFSSFLEGLAKYSKCEQRLGK